MVIETKGYDMEKRGKLLSACPQYVLTEEEADEYDSWTLIKKESNNTLVIEGGRLMMLHLKYIRPFDSASTCIKNTLQWETSRAFFCESCFKHKGRPLFSLFSVNFGSLEYVLAGVRALNYLEYMLLCPIRLFTLLVKLKGAHATLGSRGHTFAIRADAAAKTVKAVRRTLPHAAGDAIILHFVFVGDKEALGLFELDATTGLPMILRLNKGVFEIDMQVLGLYATVLLARQVPIYAKYVSLSDPTDIAEINTLVQVAFSQIHFITDAEASHLDDHATATVAGAPADGEKTTTFTHSYMSFENVLADLVVPADEVTAKEVQSIMQAIPLPPQSKGRGSGSLRNPIKVTSGNQLVNEYTDFTELMSSIAPVELLNGWPYEMLKKDNAKAYIADTAILTHMLMQADHKFWSNNNALMELFNFWKQRRVVAATVSNMWNRDRESITNINTILEGISDLAKLVKNPQTKEAKALATLLRPYCRKLSDNIPYAKQSGSAQMTICIAYGRFFGNGILFSTLNPSIIKQPMFNRFLPPLANNNEVSQGEAAARIAAYEALSIQERKTLQIRNPAASALTYIFLTKSIFTKLYLFPLNHQGKATDAKIMRPPWRDREDAYDLHMYA